MTAPMIADKYERNNWVKGDVVSADKLNNIENGIEEAMTPELPEVNSTDNGKVMKVENGKWKKGFPNKELPTLTVDDNGKALVAENGVWTKKTIKSGGGGGSLPAVEGSGKALVSVDGEWKETDGYGYTISGNRKTIVWDGNTEGRETLEIEGDVFYKIADDFVSVDDLIDPIYSNGYGSSVLPMRFIQQLSDDMWVLLISSYGTDLISAKQGIHTFGGIDVFIPGGVYTTERGISGPFTIEYGIKDKVTKIDPKYIGEGQYGYVEAPKDLINVEWDGNIEGKTKISILEEEGMTAGFFKIADIHSDVYGKAAKCTMRLDGVVHNVDCEQIPAQGSAYIYAANDAEVPSALVTYGGTIKFTIEGLGEITAEDTESGVYLFYMGQSFGGSDANAYTSSLSIGNFVTHKIDKKYMPEGVFEKPLADYETLEWGKETQWGSAYGTEFVLPRVESGYVVNEITLTFKATSSSYSFTAPSVCFLGDENGFGRDTGNTITYDDFTEGYFYEIKFKVISDYYIAMTRKEWAILQ